MGTLRALEEVLAFAPRETHRLDVLDLEQLEVLRDTFMRLVEFKHEKLDLQHRLRQLRAVLEMYGHPPLRFLGLFAMLEAALTHQPAPHDPTESLGRQVKKKMALLGRRFDFPLPYEEYFEIAEKESDRAWSDLYSLRSAFAHGTEPDFAKKLKLLKNLEHATAFVRLATSAVLRQRCWSRNSSWTSKTASAEFRVAV
jgi:hypothetical protein